MLLMIGPFRCQRVKIDLLIVTLTERNWKCSPGHAICFHVLFIFGGGGRWQVLVLLFTILAGRIASVLASASYIW